MGHSPIGRRILACMLFFLSPYLSHSQIDIPVNPYTGTGNFQIPIWTVSSRDVSDPVSLSYSVRGIKLNERGGRFGVAWDINAGGSVSREVRGLPDDFKGTGNDRRRGWLYQKYSTSTYLSSDVAALPNTSDNVAGSPCTDESSDYNQLNGYGYDNDTEPDIFHFSAGGYSGSFVFDNNSSATPVVKLIPYQDIKIVPTFNPGASDPKITGFTITTNTGQVFTFNDVVWESRYTYKLISETTVEFLKTRYEQYNKLGNHDNKPVNYHTEWKLSKAASPGSDELTYSYVTDSVVSVDTVRAYMVRNSDSKYFPVDVFWDYRKTAYRHLNMISVKETASTTKKVIELVATGNLVTLIKIYDYRSSNANGFIKQFELTYNTVHDRVFFTMLKQVSGSTDDTPYMFSYHLNYLPSRKSKEQDYWGYYNGKANTHLAPRLYVYPGQPAGERFRFEQLSGYTEGSGQHTMPGANRSVDTTFIQFGSLSRIHYPSGGYTQIRYESNEYYDTVANQNFKGGGLRIKSLHHYDIMRSDMTMSRHFKYVDNTGKSYGRLLSKPQFAVITWEYRDPFSSTEQIPVIDDEGNWTSHNKIIVRFEEDISASTFTQGSAVGYKQVKVTVPGAGYSIHEYDMPGIYGTSSSGEWTATPDKFARTTGCPTIQWFTSGINGFPYAPNPNFDHARGLLTRKRDFNEGDTLVMDTRLTYQQIYKTGSAPDYVQGVRFEKYPNSDANMFLFGKYFLITDVARVPATENVTTFDVNNPAKMLTQATHYYYESSYHKLLNHTKTVLADSTEQHWYVQYPQDYPSTSIHHDEQTESINTLKTLGRTGIPIETFTTLKKKGDVERVISGSLTEFSDWDIVGELVAESIYTWNSAPIAKTSFTTSWTDESFYKDSRYEKQNTFMYDWTYDTPLTTVGKSKVPVTTVLGYNFSAPVVTATGTGAMQFAFSDFETTTTVKFVETGTINSTSRTGAKGLQLSGGSLTKTGLSKASSTYRFSGWFKHSASAITFNIKIQNTAGSTTYYNQNITFTPTTATGTFEYFEQEVPIDPALSTFKIVVTPVTTSPAWHVDDVAFAPIQAVLTSYTYTFPYGVNSTTQNHTTNFVEFDVFGRVKYIRDKDRNILKKETTTLNTY